MSSEDRVVAGPWQAPAAGEDARQNSADPTRSSTITPAVGESHPAANLFPLMEESALADLSADIKANGLRDPIWRHPDGRIIDGRNRWLACQRVGVECRHRTYSHGDETIIPFVVSHNLHRRHLTTAQRAAVAADIANLGRGTNQHSVKGPSIEGTSQAQAAQMMGVSVASVERAAAVRRTDPVLHKKVRAGEITAGKARATIADTTDRSPPKTVVEVNADAGPDVDAAHNNHEHALRAITAVARLKVSGTAAARDYQWTEAELRMAEKAAKWLKMFNRVGRTKFNSSPASGVRS
jgi:ParB-like chromosome segregation protein Spo0J